MSEHTAGNYYTLPSVGANVEHRFVQGDLLTSQARAIVIALRALHLYPPENRSPQLALPEDFDSPSVLSWYLSGSAELLAKDGQFDAALSVLDAAVGLGQGQLINGDHYVTLAKRGAAAGQDQWALGIAVSRERILAGEPTPPKIPAASETTTHWTQRDEGYRRAREEAVWLQRAAAVYRAVVEGRGHRPVEPDNRSLTEQRFHQAVEEVLGFFEADTSQHVFARKPEPTYYHPTSSLMSKTVVIVSRLATAYRDLALVETTWSRDILDLGDDPDSQATISVRQYLGQES